MTTKTLANPQGVTLLELVVSTWERCNDEEAVVNHVRKRLQEGTYVLCGNFRDERPEDL